MGNIGWICDYIAMYIQHIKRILPYLIVSLTSVLVTGLVFSEIMNQRFDSQARYDQAVIDRLVACSDLKK
jgi:hypothetical protein